MNLKTLIFTQNACYKSGKKHVPKGILVHSTGANNPKLSRYVGPDDGLLGKNPYNNHWNQPMDRSVCVHAFIGKLADGSIATYQTLPWDMVGWHSGSGRLGASKNANNNGYIGFEICEDGLKDPVYFAGVYKEAVELCAMLCEMFNLDPLKDGVIIGHYEGYKRGIASNHSDPGNWFPKHGKSMDTLRADVKKLLGGSDKMRYFEILGNEVMNLRATAPNGKIIKPIPTGTIIQGIETLTASNGTIWLKTNYDGIGGWVAVLPESKGYTKEVPAPAPTDYEPLYKAEQTKNDVLTAQVSELAADNAALRKEAERQGKEIVILQSEYDQAIKAIKAVKAAVGKY